MNKILITGGAGFLGSHLTDEALVANYPSQRQLNIELAKAKLGWELKVNLGDGLQETIAYEGGGVAFQKSK